MPLQSMTAYGYGERAESSWVYTCEMRSLNSRFLEVTVRLPRHLLALESDIINHVKGSLKRGKCDVFLDVQEKGASKTKDLPALDSVCARHYLALVNELNRLGTEAGFAPFPTASAVDFLQLEGVLDAQGQKERGPKAAESHRGGVFSALNVATEALIAARLKEGSALGAALLDLLKELDQRRILVHAARDRILPELQQTLLSRVQSVVELLEKAGQPARAELSKERLVQEVTLASDKADIDEELTRLTTHIKEAQRLMVTEEAAGRKLDFMCQELHREVNTMSNKLLQTDVAQHTLEMKQIIERIRQQVQNIE